MAILSGHTGNPNQNPVCKKKLKATCASFSYRLFFCRVSKILSQIKGRVLLYRFETVAPVALSTTSISRPLRSTSSPAAAPAVFMVSSGTSFKTMDIITNTLTQNFPHRVVLIPVYFSVSYFECVPLIYIILESPLKFQSFRMFIIPQHLISVYEDSGTRVRAANFLDTRQR